MPRHVPVCQLISYYFLKIIKTFSITSASQQRRPMTTISSRCEKRLFRLRKFNFCKCWYRDAGNLTLVYIFRMIHEFCPWLYDWAGQETWKIPKNILATIRTETEMYLLAVRDQEERKNRQKPSKYNTHPVKTKISSEISKFSILQPYSMFLSLVARTFHKNAVMKYFIKSDIIFFRLSDKNA